MTGSFAIAPNFQCKGSWADRLLVAVGDGWRVPNQDEVSALTNSPSADSADGSRLFSIPMHLRYRFWAMLDEEAAEASGDFDSFSGEVAQFLTFKDLSPPTDSVCELLVQDAGGTVATADVWALINFGEEPVSLAWPQLRLRLGPGEGLQIAAGSTPDVVPPAKDELNALVVIRFAPAQRPDVADAPTP